MGKSKLSEYYAPGTSYSTVNPNVAVRLTQPVSTNWPGFEIINLSTNRPIAVLDLDLKGLREGDSGTVGFRNKVNVLLTNLNMRLLTAIPQFQPPQAASV